MPRKPIDYSNTIIYKLCCKDPSITDVYVGHTTNFTNRKGHHKINCNNEEGTKNHYYVYSFIREHGGWNNWEMIQIEHINCVDDIEARTHERHHLELLGATLNKVIPTRTKQEWISDNKEHIQQLQSDWYIKNKEISLCRAHERYTQKIEYIKEYNKKYHSDELNKERAKQKRQLKKLEINNKLSHI